MLPSLEKYQQRASRWATRLRGAEAIYIPWHVASTRSTVHHWVLVRLSRVTQKIEIYESARLLVSKAAGWKILSALQPYLGSGCGGWTVVLYNSCAARIPRQRDGSSCGVFLCIIALHLVRDACLPLNLQDNVGRWRNYLALAVSI